MKITVYTVSDCQFSKAEKEYLSSHNLPFEEKNLELNREYLTEMLAVSNNFAGTPVTKIEKDDGQIVILKGFTKEEFDETLGLNEEKEKIAQTNAAVNLPPSPPPQSPPPVNPPTQPTASAQPQPESQYQPSIPPQSDQPPQPPISSPPSQPPQSIDDPLNSILANLEEKANLKTSSQPSTNQENQSNLNSSLPSNLPNIPDFNDKV